MKFYDDIKSERDRIQSCISKFGWTSDHNLDWFADSVITSDGKPVFVQWPDGTGLFAHRYSDQWRIWSDPLCPQKDTAERVKEFALEVLAEEKVKEIWCDDVSDSIYPDLEQKALNVEPIYYSLFWPVLDLSKFDPTLPGRHFKEMRNAKNKFFNEHELEVIGAKELPKEQLHRMIEKWKGVLHQNKEEVYDLRYHNAIDGNFRGFDSARAMMVDGAPIGINAGYDVPNKPGRFAGVIGIHDYSIRDIGIIFYLEDLEWMKSAGYKEVDLQGSEEDEGLNFKLRFGAVVERKTNTFSIRPANVPFLSF